MLKAVVGASHTQCGWICFDNNPFNLDLIINGKVLSKLHTVVDLGLKHSYNSSFLRQVSKQNSKSQRLLSCIIHNFYNNEYKVCISLLLEYCTFIFRNVRIRDKQRLKSVQRRSTVRALGTDCILSPDVINLDSTLYGRANSN